MIDEEVKREIVKVFSSKEKELAVEILEATGVSARFQVLVESNASITPSNIAKGLKGASSYFINHFKLKDNKIRGIYWQDEYGAIPVSPSAANSLGYHGTIDSME